MQKIIKALRFELWGLALIGLALVLYSARAQALTTTFSRISVDGSGTQSNNHSNNHSASYDGRYVAFMSEASNLVASDTNGTQDLFVKDTVGGSVERVNLTSAGAQFTGNYTVYEPFISGTGRYVAFSTNSNQIYTSIYHTGIEAYLYDTVTDTTSMVSQISGTEGNGHSYVRSVSVDGRFVLIQSAATNFVASDTNGQYDLFVKDMVTGQFTTVNQNASGNPAGYVGGTADLNCDGSLVAYSSFSTTVVDSDASSNISSQSDIFLADLRNGYKNTNVTKGGNNESSIPSISCDGSAIAFESLATNLAGSDTNSRRDIYWYGVVDKNFKNASTTSGGTLANSDSNEPNISEFGDYVVFASPASNLDGTAGSVTSSQIYLKNVKSGAVDLISREQDNTATSYASINASVSFDGKVAHFETEDGNVVPSDTNAKYDIFKVTIN